MKAHLDAVKRRRGELSPTSPLVWRASMIVDVLEWALHGRGRSPCRVMGIMLRGEEGRKEQKKRMDAAASLCARAGYKRSCNVMKFPDGD
jgi:hypothetical protein